MRINKLRYYGLQDSAMKLMKCYLNNRKQLVQYSSVTSGYLELKTGVPQGSILGPLLFIIYLNDLVHACTQFIPIIYADDTALSTVLETLDPSHQHFDVTINEELENISNWFKLNKLSVNGTKTKAMFFHPVQKSIDNISLYIDGTAIDFVKEFKYLGIILDSHLSWKPHLKQISQKIAKTNGIMTRLKNFLPCIVLKKIYNSLILPYLSYGILVWGACAERLLNYKKNQFEL